MGDSSESNKDRRSRAKKNDCKKLVGELVDKIASDEKSYFQTWKWDTKKDLVSKAMMRLNDPQFALELLTLLIQQIKSSSFNVSEAESALQVLKLFFQQSKDIVQNQESANEIHESPPDFIPPNQNGSLQIQAKALQETKEESQSYIAELMEIMALLNQKQQSLMGVKVYAIVAAMLQKVVNSCSVTVERDIFNQDCTNKVQGHHGVKIEGGQLILDFNAEVHNQEMIVQENHEVTLILQLVAGRLAELKLATEIPNQVMMDLQAEQFGSLFNMDSVLESNFNIDDLDNFFNSDWKDEIGCSNAATNEANLKLPPDETCFVQGYKVFKQNADVLDEIFQKHPKIAENFRVAHPDLQSSFMNSLAEVSQKIVKSNPMILQPDDIKSMELMVGDMEHNGLQISWLNEKLKEVREDVRVEQEKKKWLEEIDMCDARKREAELKLAMLEKKPRLE